MSNFIPQPHVCDVCRLLDNDESIKDCNFCERCQAWICADDFRRWDRRARAMVKMWGNQFGPVYTPPASEQPSRACKKCGKD